MSKVWFDALAQFNDNLIEHSLKRQLHIRSSAHQTAVHMDDAQYVSFSSNDYLGLANHPLLTQAMGLGATTYGVGSGASALISGHTQIHAELERQLARTQEHAIPNVGACYINTGYMANLAMLSALCSLGKTSIYSDTLNHASLIDGIRLAKVQAKAQVWIYGHCHVAELETLLQQDPNPFKLIVTDSVFSMDGNIAHLPTLIEIAERYNALIYIDDAHGFGVFGEHGHGCLEHFGVHSANIIYMGTLGKAAGVSGAFLAADRAWIDLLIQKARPVIFSTAPSPAVAFTVLKSLELLASEEGNQRREKLFKLIRYWQERAHFTRWQAIYSPSAIQPLIIGDNAVVVNLSASLKEAGFWIPAIRPPTVAVGSARLRIALSADHEEAQLQHLLATLKKLETT